MSASTTTPAAAAAAAAIGKQCQSCQSRKAKETCGGSCGRRLCSYCCNFCVLPAGLSGAGGLISCCLDCFKAASALDVSRTHDVSGPEGAPTLLFLHGGCGCRVQWAPQIRTLSARYRCYAMDLPGHGALRETALSLESAVEVVIAFVRTTIPGGRCVGLGYSLGGYVLMEAVGRAPELFAGAVIGSSGQNVGVGRGIAASLGLVALKATSGWFGAKRLTTMLVNSAREHIEQSLIDEILRYGFFFESSAQQVDLLRATNPAASLPKYSGPVLFVSGDKDHHDSQDKWARLCSGAGSRSVIYKGTDHFFSHDAKYQERFISDITEFLTAACHWPAAAATVVEVVADRPKESESQEQQQQQQ